MFIKLKCHIVICFHFRRWYIIMSLRLWIMRRLRRFIILSFNYLITWLRNKILFSLNMGLTNLCIRLWCFSLNLFSLLKRIVKFFNCCFIAFNYRSLFHSINHIWFLVIHYRWKSSYFFKSSSFFIRNRSIIWLV